MPDTRTTKERVALSEEKVLDFFEERGRNYQENKPYTSVLYQDKNPHLAEERDKYEKSLITPQLALNNATRVLDIGCGIGRWADSIAPDIGSYVGADISPSLIKIAQDRNTHSNCKFIVSGADNFPVDELLKDGPFDLVIMAGILIYLNDDAVVRCLRNLATVCSDDARIYLREPLALDDRLTLKEFWSNDLEQNYSAIYRSASELNEVFENTIFQQGFNPTPFLMLYQDDELNNRRETAQHYAIFKRSSAT